MDNQRFRFRENDTMTKPTGDGADGQRDVVIHLPQFDYGERPVGGGPGAWGLGSGQREQRPTCKPASTAWLAQRPAL